ncbi:MAG TPA: tRNA CCA-pyrophosphorylase [Candidatus Syntrophoarchaeum butanivorans]|uniref:Formylmethanofuran dehydrogenase subunit D n=1 Tax=Candidatus Syntropharchaeum butanivorans TaxID=1839936 RepID=A0A1F2P5L6_9EURY|nr:MAG: formylmethanofuran dehydrogenase subunit D [Candidatus Syntrophoarchaeum butanivorans]RJS71898.1 MAG: tRNA CCA-pyrophosphorylase [Candidatus Syntrophoarchaeum sp. WYZ-LMO15]HDM36424.1 tRNA CCA-pyrophosphorylase [Candidatus Syntrophoarchaeum butanivorans]HEC57038.1 tRNA CCA-pyrophosphorylase [Candidatus Syntrophoarchaeum butanivorans]
MRKVILITGRTIDQGKNLENKMSDEYLDAVARCEMNESLLSEIGATEGDTVRVKTEFGDVVVRAAKDDGLPDGLVFIPMGPWANAVVDTDTGGVGTPGFKGVEATVERTDAPVLPLKELIASYKEA